MSDVISITSPLLICNEALRNLDKGKQNGLLVSSHSMYKIIKHINYYIIIYNHHKCMSMVRNLNVRTYGIMNINTSACYTTRVIPELVFGTQMMPQENFKLGWVDVLQPLRPRPPPPPPRPPHIR